MEVEARAKELTFSEFNQVPAACNYNWTYTVSTLEVHSMKELVDFKEIIKNNPALEGIDEYNLVSLNNNVVSLKTIDKKLEDRYFAVFVTGTLGVSPY